MKTPPSRVYKVELFVEVPAHISNPERWAWDALVNKGVRKEQRTPVQFVLAHEQQEGHA